jgi:hypothetical protein
VIRSARPGIFSYDSDGLTDGFVMSRAARRCREIGNDGGLRFSCDMSLAPHGT